jgi:hypothetical protein
MCNLPTELRLRIYELLLPPRPWTIDVSSARVWGHNICENIRVEAEQIFVEGTGKAVFGISVREDSFYDLGLDLFDIRNVQSISIEIWASPFACEERLEYCEDDSQKVHDPDYYYTEEVMPSTTLQVSRCVEQLKSATSLTQLAVGFRIDRLSVDDWPEDKGEECEEIDEVISFMRTATDLFKTLHGIEKARLTGVYCGRKWGQEPNYVLDETRPAFNRYKKEWEHAISVRSHHSLGLSTAKQQYYQLVDNRLDMLEAVRDIDSGWLKSLHLRHLGTYVSSPILDPDTLVQDLSSSYLVYSFSVSLFNTSIPWRFLS